MAKRYAKYEELKAVSGSWVPPGVLGKHFATIVHQDDKIVVVGSRSGRVTLRPGDTLGYNCGEVWILSRPESYKDTMRRFLAERKVAQRVLEPPMRDRVIEVTERWYDQYHCPNGRPTHEWVTDGKKVEFEREELESSQGYFTGGGRRQIRIEDASYAIRVDYNRHMNGQGYYRVTRIVVWPGYDENKVMVLIRRYHEE